MTIIHEAFRNTIVGVLTFLFTIIIICVLLVILYKTVLVNIDWKGLFIKKIGDLLQ